MIEMRVGEMLRAYVKHIGTLQNMLYKYYFEEDENIREGALNLAYMRCIQIYELYQRFGKEFQDLFEYIWDRAEKNPTDFKMHEAIHEITFMCNEIPPYSDYPIHKFKETVDRRKQKITQYLHKDRYLDFEMDLREYLTRVINEWRGFDYDVRDLHLLRWLTNMCNHMSAAIAKYEGTKYSEVLKILSDDVCSILKEAWKVYEKEGCAFEYVKEHKKFVCNMAYCMNRAKREIPELEAVEGYLNAVCLWIKNNFVDTMTSAFVKKNGEPTDEVLSVVNEKDREFCMDLLRP